MPDIQQVLKELQETAFVMSGIQSRQATLLREHTEWLASHDKAILEMREQQAAAIEREARIDERIEKLVIAIGKLIPPGK